MKPPYFGALVGGGATMDGMPAFTRRRDPAVNLENWLMHYGDVRVGSIGRREGNPTHTDQWEWGCGFYPGSERCECYGSRDQS